MLKVYIAGQLTRLNKNDERTPSQVVVDYIKNLNKMCQMAFKLIQYGFAPYVPGLDFLLGVVSGRMEERDYRNIGIEFLKVCDAVLVLSMSPGVKNELAIARKYNIKIFYSFEKLLAWQEKQKGEKYAQ